MSQKEFSSEQDAPDSTGPSDQSKNTLATVTELPINRDASQKTLKKTTGARRVEIGPASPWMRRRRKTKE
jgi:hypothetical protein